MGDNTVQIRVATDLSSVSASVNTTQLAIRRTIAESLAQQKTSAAEAEAIYKELGITGAQAAREIQAAFGEVPGAVEASASQTSVRVSGSIREMFPVLSDLRQITRLAMGAFAAGYIVEEMGRVIQVIQEAADTWGGFNQTVQKGLADDIKDSDDALVHFRGLSIEMKILDGERMIADTERALIAARLRREMLQDSQTTVKTLAEVLLALDTFGLGLVPLIKNKMDLNTATKEETALKDRQIAQLKELGILESQESREKAAAAKKAAEDAEQAAEAKARRDESDARFVEKTLKANIASTVQWREAQERLVESLGKGDFGALDKKNEQLRQTAHAYILITQDLDLFTAAQRRNAQISRQAGGDQIASQVRQTIDLATSRRGLISVTQELQSIEAAFTQALHGELGPLEAMTLAAGGIGEQFAQVIGGTKATAGVKGAFDAALSIEYLAQFIASWGSDTAAGLASVQYGLAAAEMFKVAGGGGGASRGGGASGGTSSSYGRGGGRGASGSGNGNSGGGGGGGAAGPGTTIHLNFPGGTLISPDTLPQVMAQMTQLAKGGQAYLVSSDTFQSGPKNS